MTDWFTSDSHWRHKNIIKYSNRPFDSTEVMNEALIDNWNSVVKQKDRIFHLGDFSMGDGQSIFDRLLGEKHLIIGNHDKQSVKINGWTSMQHYKEININGQHIVMSHYAMRVWNRSHYGAWMLYGHSHGSLPDDPNALSFDVGVDCHNYAPINMRDIKAIMDKKTYKPVDHHRGSHKDTTDV